MAAKQVDLRKAGQKYTIDDSEAEQSIMTEPLDENVKKSDIEELEPAEGGAMKPKPTKVDSKGSDIKESKVAEDVKSCCGAKEPKTTKGDPQKSDIKESKVTEDIKSCCDKKKAKLSEDDGKESKSTKCSTESSNVKKIKASEGNLKELKPTEGDVKEFKPAKGDPKSSDTKESNASEDVKICCDTKTSKFVKGDEKESESTDGDRKSSDVENPNLSSKQPTGKITRTNSPTSICSSTTVDCAAATIKDPEDDKRKSKFISNVDYLEKGMPSHKHVEMPEFYKLGLVGSPESSESKPNDFVLVSDSECSAKPEGACFNWIKRVGNSPQKLFSRFRKYTSPKSGVRRPMISSECHGDGSFKSPGLSPIGTDRHFVLAFMGKNQDWMIPVDRIDYSKLAEEKIIPAFLGMHPCYDVMPTSGKVIVLSVDLLVKNAFSALVTNEIKAAPLWDTGLHDFIGMLTISDFINVLRHYFYSNPEDIKDIENQAISTWRKMTKMSNKFIKINGSDSLALATKLLIQEGVHRIPVFDEKRKCVLFVLTRKRLLQYLSYSLFEKFEKSNIKTPSFFRKTLRELQVGTYENIATTTVDGRVIDALDLFVERKVSSLPVVDENGELKDIFEKFDVFVLAKEQTYHNLEMTVLEAITKAGNREGAVICTLDESLGTVINKFVNSKVHRIVVINERRIVTGIVSLSDILKFLVVQPLVAMEDSNLSTAASDIIEEGAEGAVGGSDVETSVFESGELDSSTSLLTEESDKNTSSLSEAITDMKIGSAKEDSEEQLDSNDVQKSE